MKSSRLVVPWLLARLLLACSSEDHTASPEVKEACSTGKLASDEALLSGECGALAGGRCYPNFESACLCQCQGAPCFMLDSSPPQVVCDEDPN